MCGIVGAASHKNIVDVLVEGLRRLEYRNYACFRRFSDNVVNG